MNEQVSIDEAVQFLNALVAVDRAAVEVLEGQVVLTFHRTRRGMGWLKVLGQAPIDAGYYYRQLGSPPGAEMCRWREETGVHYLTIWWNVEKVGRLQVESEEVV